MAAIDGAARGSRYADQRHYVVPASLADLHGPAGGRVTLDRSLRCHEGGKDGGWQRRGSRGPRRCPCRRPRQADLLDPDDFAQYGITDHALDDHRSRFAAWHRDLYAESTSE